MTDKRLNRMRNVLDKRQLDLRVLLEKVHKPHNLSAILRSCDAVGVNQVHAILPDEMYRVNRRHSAGNGQWVDVEIHDDSVSAIKDLQIQGFTVYAAHLSDDAVCYTSVDYTQPSVVLLGTEKYGVTPEASAAVDKNIVIPMMGMGQSLNVSVAAAVILYEAQRQRAQKGMYDTVKFDEHTYKTKLFEWMQPKMAKYCQRKGIEYPDIDEDGAIIELDSQFR
ncbi:MAG: tRNA (guanosine(18)-2'-O)-methyltransferase TrmH [Gammaproteobacteria bacterium]|nr:MAG: tRNA (guanosine(18)-2'-O)-methyltransferase TrmH [Gammaproteobacteria bacterium]